MIVGRKNQYLWRMIFIEETIWVIVGGGAVFFAELYLLRVSLIDLGVIMSDHVVYKYQIFLILVGVAILQNLLFFCKKLPSRTCNKKSTFYG